MKFVFATQKLGVKDARVGRLLPVPLSNALPALSRQTGALLRWSIVITSTFAP
jgi:hypothetical protein